MCAKFLDPSYDISGAFLRSPEPVPRVLVGYLVRDNSCAIDSNRVDREPLSLSLSPPVIFTEITDNRPPTPRAFFERKEGDRRSFRNYLHLASVLQAPLSAHYITGGPNGGVATVKRTSAVGTLATHV